MSEPMSVPVSALGGASFDGFAQVSDAGLRGMVTIRCDLGEPALLAAASDLGLGLPEPLGTSKAGDNVLAWMSPDELLLLCPYEAAPDLTVTLTGALADTHSLVADVSDARAVFSVRGALAMDVLKKLTPVDLALMAPGSIRRSRLAQVAAAIHMVSATQVDILVFRSHAQYTFDLLTSAAKAGSELTP